jgi:hypothetical protein
VDHQDGWQAPAAVSPDDAEHLPELGPAGPARFRVRMHARRRDSSRQVANRNPLADLDPDVPVHGPREILVHEAHGLPRGTPYERGRLKNVVVDLDLRQSVKGSVKRTGWSCRPLASIRSPLPYTSIAKVSARKGLEEDPGGARRRRDATRHGHHRVALRYPEPAMLQGTPVRARRKTRLPFDHSRPGVALVMTVA